MVIHGYKVKYHGRERWGGCLTEAEDEAGAVLNTHIIPRSSLKLGYFYILHAF